jgi:hypothetical protein
MRLLLLSAVAVLVFVNCVSNNLAGTADDVNSGSILGCIARDPRSPLLDDTVTVNLYGDDTTRGLLKMRAARPAPLKTLRTTGTTYRFDSLAPGSYRIHVLRDSIIIGKKEDINLTAGKRDTVDLRLTIIIKVLLTILPGRDIAVTGLSIDNGRIEDVYNGYLLTIAEVDTQYFEIEYDRGAVSKTTEARIVLGNSGNAVFELVPDSIAVLTSSSPSGCIIPGAVACLRFDDGLAIDASGNGNHGRVVGAIPTTNRFGRPHAALRFNGKDNYVIVDTLRGTIPGNTPKSISGWFRSEHYSKYLQMLFGYGAQISGNNFQIGVGPLDGGIDTPYVFRVNGWGNDMDWRTGIPAIRFFDGTWHHCVLAYDGSATKVYFDGSLAAQTRDTTFDTVSAARLGQDTFPVIDTLVTYDRESARYDTTYKRITRLANFHFVTPASPTLVIGREIDLNEWEFDGDLDDIRVFNRAINDYEVTLLFHGD